MYNINNVQSNGIIVLGGHVQGLGIIRIFGKNGIPSVLIDDTESNIARHSKYCRAFHKSLNILDTLRIFIQNDQYKKWIIIPTNDAQVELLSKNKEELSFHYKVATEDWEILKYCYNKRETYRIAKESGLYFPTSYFPNNLDELKAITVEFPCIIKPAVMHSFYKAFKKKVFVCNNKEELISYYNLALQIIPADEIIIQQIIPGVSEHQYSVCYYYNKVTPIVTLCARRKRQHPLDFGNATTYAETVHIQEILEFSNSILKNIGYTGLCEVEFKYDTRDNKYKFLEINPRTWKWHYISEISGSPFLMTLYNSMHGIETTNTNTWKDSSWQHFTTDYFVIFQQILNGSFKFRNRKNPKIQAVLSINDIKPFLYEMIYLPFLIRSR
jgi:D-aspartate ligase